MSLAVAISPFLGVSFSEVDAVNSTLRDLDQQVQALMAVINQGEDPSEHYEELYGELPEELNNIWSLEPGELRQWAKENEDQAAATADEARLAADRVDALIRDGVDEAELYGKYVELYGYLSDQIDAEIEDPAALRREAQDIERQAGEIAVLARLVADRVEDMERKGKEAERELENVAAAGQALLDEHLASFDSDEERDAAEEALANRYDWL